MEKNSEFSKVRIKPKSERPMHSNGFNDDCNVFSHVYVIKADLTMYYLHHEENNKLVEWVWVWHLITLSTCADTGLLKINTETNTQTPIVWNKRLAYQINPQLVVELSLVRLKILSFAAKWNSTPLHWDASKTTKSFMPFRKWFL